MPDSSVFAHVLWARSKRYMTPFVVRAWSEGYGEAWSDAFHEEVNEAKRWVNDFGDAYDGPWEFMLTMERMTLPTYDEWEAFRVAA